MSESYQEIERERDALLLEVARLRERYADGSLEEDIEALRKLCLDPSTDTLFRCISEGNRVFVVDAESQLRPLFLAQPAQDGEVAALRTQVGQLTKDLTEAREVNGRAAHQVVALMVELGVPADKKLPEVADDLRAIRERAARTNAAEAALAAIKQASLPAWQIMPVGIDTELGADFVVVPRKAFEDNVGVVEVKP